MTTPPTIRQATPSDAPAVLRLIRGLAEYERVLPEVTATQDDIRKALSGPVPQAHAILAEVAEAPVGLALFYYTFNTFKAHQNIFLEDLFVESTYRNFGIGVALMRHLAQIAIAGGCGRLEWRVLNWNQPAIDFYNRLGATSVDDWHTRQLGGSALVALSEGKPHG